MLRSDRLSSIPTSWLFEFWILNLFLWIWKSPDKSSALPKELYPLLVVLFRDFKLFGRHENPFEKITCEIPIQSEKTSQQHWAFRALRDWDSAKWCRRFATRTMQVVNNKRGKKCARNCLPLRNCGQQEGIHHEICEGCHICGQTRSTLQKNTSWISFAQSIVRKSRDKAKGACFLEAPMLALKGKTVKEKCPQSVFQFEVWHCFPRHLLGSDLEPWSMKCRSWQLLWGDMKPNTVSWCEELLEVSSQPPFKVLSPSVQLRRVQPLTPAAGTKTSSANFAQNPDGYQEGQ